MADVDDIETTGILLNPELLSDFPSSESTNVDLMLTPSYLTPPTDILTSPEFEDQLIVETTKELNRLTDILNSKSGLPGHLKGQLVSRKFQGLKLLSDQLVAKRHRASGGALHLLTMLLQSLNKAMDLSGVPVEKQSVIINNLGTLFEQSQKVSESKRKLSS